MKRKLFLLLCALLTMIGVQAQGTWEAPAVPGVNPGETSDDVIYYLYNVESDAFVTYGMQWGSMATARRLHSGDQAESSIHKMKVSKHNGYLRFHLEDNKYADRFLSDNGGEFGCYVDTWQGASNDNANVDFSYSSGVASGAYTLTNVGTSHKLDVHWLYGGQLTGENGMGFIDWAIIPETSITDGSYAKYKEKKQMYEVYQALIDAGVVSTYTSALETANAVYLNGSSTVADLRAATRTLINAAAEDIASSINGNSLFDDTDMWGNQALNTWTSTDPSNNTGGEYETYNIHFDFNQTHEVPNGTYKIVFHSLFRNDGGGTAPRISVTDGELDGGGTVVSANVPLFTSLSFLPTNTAGASGNIKDGNENRGGYYADWKENNSVIIPNGRRSSADAMAHTDAVASVDNFKVTTGKMNIRLIIDQDNQWVNFQGFDIIFYGSTTGKLYRDLVDLLETANGLTEQAMKADVLSALNTAISSSSELSKSSSEDELEEAISTLTAAIGDAQASADAYAKANATLTVMKATIDGTNVYTTAAYTTYNGSYSSYKGKYDNRTLTNEEAATLYNDVLPLTRVANSEWHKANSTDDFLLSAWSVDGEQCADFDKALYINTWSAEGDNDGSNFQTPFFEYWTSAASLDAKKLSATVTGLTPNNAYDVSALVRVSGDSKVAGSITLSVNGGLPVDVTAGDPIGTTGRYIKTFTATGVADASGNLEISFDVAANSNISWFTFKDVKYATSAAETTNDYTALNAAIDAAEAKTLGFETGEYAPYNNVDALTKLAAAKSINQSGYNITSYVSAATLALNNATWTANVAEVNAFYKGDFDGYAEDTSSPLDYTPNGWTATDNFRVMLKNEENYPGLADASVGTAPMSWSGGITYGETAGYEMPLKANTIYRLQFKAAGWNNETRSGMSVSILNGTDGMALYNLGTPDRDIKGNETNTAGMTSYDIVFATGAAGNYVFHIQSGNNFVVTDFSITKAASQTLTFADNAAMPIYAPGTYPNVSVGRALTADTWSTLVMPVNMNIPDGWSVMEMSSFEENTLDFTAASSIEAGKPYMVNVNSDVTDIVASNVEVSALNLNDVTVGGLTMKGVYEAGSVPESVVDGATRYVVSGNQLHKVTSAVSIKPFRAYFELIDSNSPARLVISFDGEDPTGINAVEATETEAGTLKDGKYLIEGKIVLVKNGVKYGANGQKLN